MPSTFQLNNGTVGVLEHSLLK